MKICLHCSNGYLFEEFYFLLIDSLADLHKLIVVVDRYYLTNQVLEKVSELKRQGRIENLILIENENWGKVGTHLKISKAAASIENIDILIVGSDNHYSCRYFIRAAAKRNAHIIAISYSSNWRLRQAQVMIRDYREPHRNTSWPRNWSSKLRQYGLAVCIKKFISLTKSVLLRKTSIFLDYYAFPLLFTGFIMPRNNSDRLSIQAGRADEYLVFDKTDELAITKLGFNTMRVRHPADGRVSRPPSTTKKLLVVFNGCLSEELIDHNFQIWVNRIQELSALVPFDVVNLRLHPRTSEQMGWPKRLSKSLAGLFIPNEICNALDRSLELVVSDCIGILGSPSGTLRWARALRKDIFILGLANCMDMGEDDQAYSLGEADYIRWLDNNSSISSTDLIPVPTIEEISSISDHINTRNFLLC